MDEKVKTQFRELLHSKFNNNLNEVNEALVKHMEIVEKKKEANKSAYQKHKDNDEFKQKKKSYDKQYYNEHKPELLNARKDKYNNDNEYKEQIKLKQKARYLELNKSRTPTQKLSDSGN